MKKLMISIGGGALLALVVGATAFAAAPQQVRAAGDAIADLLGLTRAQVQDMRQDGRSLADIAATRDVSADTLVDALTARWTERIQARVAAGALTAEEADALMAQVETRARAMVQSTEPGGMAGAAVGAGKGANGTGANGAGYGTGSGGNADGAPYGDGDGDCDGTGPHGPAGR
jgi:lambda repressor-like predicted transcriptional regulator